jgi:hypothetical protein
MWPGVSVAQWLLGGVKKHYAACFCQRMLKRNSCRADAFFGTMTAGTTAAATIGAFLAASSDSRIAEIGLHPGLVAAVNRRQVDAWHDPLAAFRPTELEMLQSAELEDELVNNGCGLARLS